MLGRSLSKVNKQKKIFIGIFFFICMFIASSNLLISQEKDYFSLKDKADVAAWLDTLALRQSEPAFSTYVAERTRYYLGTFTQEKYAAFLSMARERFGARHAVVAAILYRHARVAYREGAYDLSAAYLQEALVIWSEQPPADQAEIAYAWYYLGRSQQEEGNLPESIDAYQQMATLSQAIGDYLLLSRSHEYLGDVYQLLEEQELVELYYDLAIIYAEKARDDQDRLLARLYMYGGSILDRKPEMAIQRYRKALAIYEAGEHQHRANYSSTKINLARALIKLKKYEEALHILLALEKQKTESNTEGELDIIYEALGSVYRRKKNLPLALDYFQKELVIRQKYYDKHSEELNYTYHNFGEVYQEMGYYSKAAEYYQKALQSADTTFVSDDFRENPNVDGGVLTTTNANLIKDLDFKGRLFLAWFHETQRPEHLRIALQSFERAADFMYAKRSELFGQGSKLIWQEQLFPVLEHYLAALYTALENSTFPGLESKIFQLMERSKALVLMESLAQQRQALDFPGRDSLEAKIREHQGLFAERQREILEKGENETRRIALLEAKIDWREAQSALKRQQPVGELAELDLLLLSKGELAAVLHPTEQGVVHYFVGEERAYVLLLTQKSSYRHSFPVDSLSRQVNDLRQLLNQPDGEWAAFAAQSHHLYGQLLAPVLSQASDSLRELLIIPDGVLSALPFEVLLTQNGLEVAGFSSAEMAYLFREYALTYAFSASTWQQQTNQKKRTGKLRFLGIAPDFTGLQEGKITRTCEANTLSPLVENSREVELIQQMLGGQTVIGVQATKAHFLAKARQARVLHLATHACVDDSEVGRSGIFFSEDQLYVHELYDLPLAAEMVVLSACETGVGTFRRGEGVMSLARGFAASGAPSLTLSYWSVSDKSTAEIMVYYYSFLSDGLPKHRALQQARIKYLSSQEQIRYLHPYYWAAFVHFGDFTPLELDSQRFTFRWTYLFLLPVLFLLLSGYKKIKKVRAN